MGGERRNIAPASCPSNALCTHPRLSGLGLLVVRIGCTHRGCARVLPYWHPKVFPLPPSPQLLVTTTSSTRTSTQPLEFC